MDAVISTTPLAASFVPNTTAVVPHGIDLSRFSPPTDKLKAWFDSGLPGQYGIGVFGRVRPDKGSDVFVKAMIQALPKLPGVTAIIAGLAQPQHQSFQQDLQRQIDAAGLHDRIVFLGEVPAGEIHLWYQRCLLCIACPRYEPFGLTPFEAAATGSALVCSRTGAFDQLALPGETGEMVDTGDVEGLCHAVLSVMADPLHAAQMGEAARARVTEHFSLAREAEGIGRVYHGLFEKAGAG
jgi:mannosyltransferase